MQNIWTVIWYHIAQSENIKWTPLYHMKKKLLFETTTLSSSSY